MENAVYVKVYDAPEICEREILRYAGAGERTPETDTLLESCLDEIKDSLTYKVCYLEVPVNFCNDYIDFGFAKSDSKDLRKNLDGSGSVVIFAATVGLEIDRLIARYSALSPAKALIFQAIGAERIEALCDSFNREIKEEKAKLGKHIKPRFSAGYGDLSVEFQKDIFKVLDCPRKIGLSLNNSLLMSPSKSVTAIIGVTDKCVEYQEKSKCESCGNIDCAYRRTV